MLRSATSNLSICALVLCLGVLSLLVTPALGQQLKSGITVTPGVVHAKVSKDTPTSQTVVTIRNNYETPVSMVAELRDIDQNSTQLLPGGELNPELAATLSLSETQITIAPRTDYKLTLQTNYNQQLTPGGHYATLLLTQVGDTGANLSLQSAVSVVLFITNTEEVKESLSLEQFAAASSPFRLASTAKVTLKNDGNVHTVPRGFVRLEKSDGTVLAEGILNVGSNLVLPGKTYSTDLHLNSVSKTWLPQRVTTQLQYRPGGSNQATVAISTGWYVPPQSVILLIAFVASIWLFVWFLLPRLTKLVKKRHGTKVPKVIKNQDIPEIDPPTTDEAASAELNTEDPGVKIAVRVHKSTKSAKKIPVQED